MSHVCNTCQQEGDDMEARTFPEPHYVCKVCADLEKRAALMQWRDYDAAQVAIGNHLSVARASWNPYSKAREWWRSVTKEGKP